MNMETYTMLIKDIRSFRRPSMRRQIDAGCIDSASIVHLDIERGSVLGCCQETAANHTQRHNGAHVYVRL